MKKLVFEFEIDNLQPEDEIEASDVYGLMYQRFPLSLVSVRAVEHSVQADATPQEEPRNGAVYRTDQKLPSGV